MEEYTCRHCGARFNRARSQVRNIDTVCCSRECADQHRKITQKGKNNPNYRDGKHVEASICECGKKKDYRSKMCARCANKSHPVEKVDRKYSDEDLREAVSLCSSYVEVAARLGCNRKTVASSVDRLGLDTSHMRRAKGRTPFLDHVFRAGKKTRSSDIRKYILRFELLEYECSECGLGPEWNGKPLTIQVDHINGDGCDDRLENLRFLCPNCHTQTDTFCGRNAKNKDRDR